MSNARFVNKGLYRGNDYATLNALTTFFEKGGTIKVAKPTKRPKKGITVSKVKIQRG